MSDRKKEIEEAIVEGVDKKTRSEVERQEPKNGVTNWQKAIAAQLDMTMMQMIQNNIGKKTEDDPMGYIMKILEKMMSYQAMSKMLGGIDMFGNGSSSKKPENDEVQKLKDEIAQMKAERQAEKQEQALKSIRDEIMQLKNNNNNSNPILDKMMEKVEQLQDEIKEGKQKALEEKLLDIQSGVNDQISNLRDTIQYISEKGGKAETSDNPITAIKRQVEEVEGIKKLFGGGEQPRERDMSPAETIDFGLGMIPKAAEGIRSLTSVLHPKEIPDDVPPVDHDSIKTPPPAAHPTTGVSLSGDIMDYINSGKEIDDGGIKLWKDAYGNMFLNTDGTIMDKQDVLRYARTSQDNFRSEMHKNIETGEKRKNEKKIIIPSTKPDIRPATQEEINKAEKSVPIPPSGITVQPRKELPPEIKSYLDRHKNTTSTVNGKDGILVGDYDEYWTDDAGNPLTPAELDKLFRSMPPDDALSQYHAVLEQAKQTHEDVLQQNPDEQHTQEEQDSEVEEEEHEEKHSTGTE